jgi:dipeptide/tripeptide permease
MIRHPPGLFRLFFIEMWERYCFYTVAFNVLKYATDTETGGLGIAEVSANDIVGTYLAMVYFTPFLGGLIADRFLGYRRSVAIGAVIMALGLFVMGQPGFTTFVAGLACVCIGNGFFKPNISVMVGHLYEKGDPRRDAGFNIFYMGINLGALAGSLIAVAVRNEFGWTWMFQAGGVGILLGLAILLASWRALERADRQPERNPDDMSFGAICQKVLLPTFAVGFAGYLLAAKVLPAFKGLPPSVIGFLFGALVVLWFFISLGRRAAEEERPGLLALLPIYATGMTFFMILHLNTTALTKWAETYTDRHSANLFDLIPKTELDAEPSYFLTAGPSVPRPREETLQEVDDKTALLFGQQRMDPIAVDQVVQRHPDLRLVVVSGSLRDRAAEQAPEAISRRATKVYTESVVTVKEVDDGHGGKRLESDVPPGSKEIAQVAFVRVVEGKDCAVTLVSGKVKADVYKRAGSERLPLGEPLRVTDTVVFQSINSAGIVLFTPLVVWFFQRRQRLGKPVPTANKILYGLLLTAASMALMIGAGALSEGGTQRVSMLWLLTAYSIVTIGELCLSPVGLSLVTKLSPKRLVGLMMGGWFVATSFGNKLSGFFGGIQGLMSPIAFFAVLTGCVLLVALFIRIVLPSLDAAIRKYGG